MSSRADVFACFDNEWAGVAESGFEATGGWVPLGRVPSGAGVELPFWDAVKLQLKGGSRSRWKKSVDFYADVLTDSAAFTRVQPEEGAVAEPFWLGMHAFTGGARLIVSSAKVDRVKPLHRFQRHLGELTLRDSKPLGFRLQLADDGTYFEVARS